jgi:hypothetical protein
MKRGFMAKREMDIIHLECPNCHKEGTSTAEENENPVYSGNRFDTKTDLSKGFYKQGDDFFCDKCNEVCMKSIK